MICISMNSIKENKLTELVRTLVNQGNKVSDYGDIEEFVDDLLGDNVDYTGHIVPYRPTTRPSYSSGGDPAEGGYVEDIEVTVGKDDITEYITCDCLEEIGFEIYESQ